MMEPRETAPCEETGDPELSPRCGTLILPVAAALLGIALVGMAANMDDRAQAGRPWIDLLLVTEGSPPWDGTVAVRARPLPDENLPLESRFRDALLQTPDGGEAVRLVRLGLREQVVAAALPDEAWKVLLASGRLPEPGKPEVLAGALTRRDTFEMDGTHFQVVGTLPRSAPGMSMVYLLSESPAAAAHFEYDRDVTNGWFDLDGATRLSELSDGPPESAGFTAALGMVPAAVPAVLCALGGVALALLGGAIACVRLLRTAGRYATPFTAILEPIRRNGPLLWGVHALLYGAFAAAMISALAFPVQNLRMSIWLTEVFTSGSLEELGGAYLAGNIPSAAWHTFVNNFYRQTFLFTILPAVGVPVLGTAFGIAKTTLSFGLGPVSCSPRFGPAWWTCSRNTWSPWRSNSRPMSSLCSWCCFMRCGLSAPRLEDGCARKRSRACAWSAGALFSWRACWPSPLSMKQ